MESVLIRRHHRGPATAVVADDHPLYRAGVVRALLETGRFTLAGETGDGQTAYELIVALRPDLAIIDVRIPRLDGLSLLSRLRAERINVPVLMLSAFTETAVVEYALAHGATAYVDKQAERDELVATAVAIVSGEPVAVAPEEPDRPALLSVECLILGLLRDGWTVRDLPEILAIDRATVDRYLLDATARLGVDRPEEAVASALAWGLLE